MSLVAQTLLCSQADVEMIFSVAGLAARLDDDGSGVVTTDEQAYFTRAANWATGQVRFYTCQLYDDADLASSFMVNYWAAVLTALMIAPRRSNPVPDSLRELAFGADGRGGVMGDLRQVRDQKQQIPDIGYRSVPWPAWSNIRVDPRYRLRQQRVERPISERTPTQYAQQVDWAAEFSWEI